VTDALHEKLNRLRTVARQAQQRAHELEVAGHADTAAVRREAVALDAVTDLCAALVAAVQTEARD
jgi:hypothetical protein